MSRKYVAWYPHLVGKANNITVLRVKVSLNKLVYTSCMYKTVYILTDPVYKIYSIYRQSNTSTSPVSIEKMSYGHTEVAQE